MNGEQLTGCMSEIQNDETKDDGRRKRAESCYRRLKEIEERILYLEHNAPISVTQFNFCSTSNWKGWIRRGKDVSSEVYAARESARSEQSKQWSHMCKSN